jgi:aspartate racemase
MKSKYQTQKKLGILGGMGASASCNWYRAIIDLLSKKYKIVQDCEYPEMCIFNLSMEGWSEKGIDNEVLAKKQLIEAIKKMDAFGVDYIIMACNTAHYFYDVLKKSTDTKFINLITTCVNYIENKGYKKVGVLSSESTNRYNLYKNKFEERGIECLSLNIKKEQYVVNNVILAVLEGKQSGREKQQLKYYIDKMKAKGAEAVILGCTELPLCINSKDVDIPLYDAGYILLDHITNLLYEDVYSVNI